MAGHCVLRSSAACRQAGRLPPGRPQQAPTCAFSLLGWRRRKRGQQAGRRRRVVRLRAAEAQTTMDRSGPVRLSCQLRCGETGHQHTIRRRGQLPQAACARAAAAALSLPPSTRPCAAHLTQGLSCCRREPCTAVMSTYSPITYSGPCANERGPRRVVRIVQLNRSQHVHILVHHVLRTLCKCGRRLKQAGGGHANWHNAGSP